MKFTNKGEHTLILGGYMEPSGYPLTVQPGEIVEADPDRLRKLYTPADLKNLEPIYPSAPKAQAPAAPAQKPADPAPAPAQKPADPTPSAAIGTRAAPAAPATDLSPAMLAHINGAQS